MFIYLETVESLRILEPFLPLPQTLCTGQEVTSDLGGDGVTVAIGCSAGGVKSARIRRF